MKTKKTIKNIIIKNDLDFVYVSLSNSKETYKEIANACEVTEQYLKDFHSRYINGHDFSFKKINTLAEYFKTNA